MPYLVVAITNSERGDNTGNTVITVCEEFYDTLPSNGNISDDAAASLLPATLSQR